MAEWVLYLTVPSRLNNEPQKADFPSSIIVDEDTECRVDFEPERRVYEPERGTCHVECFGDGVDEALDDLTYLGAKWYLSCGHEVEGSERPNFCSTCGAKVVNA